MSSSSDTDSESEDFPTVDDELSISKVDALKNYEEAGTLIPEQADDISFEKYGDLMNSSCDQILESILADLALPYKLAPFQMICLNIILQKKDLVLLSPTGSGKENY